jgi:hypothetical protein
MQEDLCNVDGCQNKAERLTTNETKYIEICLYHFYEKYRK